MRRLLPTLACVALLAVSCSQPTDIPDWAHATAVPAPVGSTAPAPGLTAAPASPPPPSPLGSDIRVVELTAEQVATQSAGVVVTVAPGDMSFTVSVVGPDEQALVGIREVRDPTGEVRYLADLRNELVIVDELHPRVLADAGAVGLYVSAPVGGILTPGDWVVDVVGNAGAPAVRVAVRAGDPLAPQVLDVVGWVTADVGDPAGLAAAWRTQMDAVLGPHGIAVGRLDLVPAGADGQPYTALGIDGLADEVHRACTAAAAATGAPDRSALVVLAGQIGEGVLSAAADRPAGTGTAYRRPDGTIDGFAVATPGTPVVGPRSHACVAVSAGDAPDGRGLIALHEILHQAGLTRHTTERSGRDFDLLADTPECPAETYDRDNDLQVTRGECADVDGDNLLFWAVGGSTMTAEQAWQVRAHPLLRPRQ